MTTTPVTTTPARPAFNGWRSVSLLFLAVFSAARAYAYLPIKIHETLPGGLHVLVDAFPGAADTALWLYACLWGAISLALVAGAFLPRDNWALSLFLGMMALNAIAYIGSWLFGFPNRDYVGAATYLGAGGFVFAVTRRRP